MGVTSPNFTVESGTGFGFGVSFGAAVIWRLFGFVCAARKAALESAEGRDIGVSRAV